jgi:tetratricopeptide (TPR) repeat protein
MMPSPHSPISSVDTEDAGPLVEGLAQEMGRRWRAGERPLAEEFLDRHPRLWQEPEAALELICEEIYLRLEIGEEAPAAELASRFPRWQRQVQALLDCHLALAPQLAGPNFPGVGETLGGFALRAELGRGAQARVFLATQPALADRAVVLKLGPCSGEEHLALARLQHTHIAPLYSAHDFPARRLRGLCLPYFGGLTLAALQEALGGQPPPQRSGQAVLDALRAAEAAAPLPVTVGGPACRFLARASYVQAACWLAACLADALQYAHERGLVHLDIKPGNVLLAADGQPMLLDFHLAREPLPQGAPAPGWLGGTPGYMAPEQQSALRAVRAGQPVPTAVDGRADVYALGMLLTELLTGQRSVGAIRRVNPQVTPGLADLLARCLEADPDRRYATTAALAADLRRHLADLPLRGVRNRSLAERWRKWRGRRPTLLPALALLLGILAAGGLGLARAGRQADQARTACRRGHDYLDQERYAEAADSFRHGLALAEDLPLGADLRRRSSWGLEAAERGQAARELHDFCERVRPLYGADHLPAAQARAAAEQCRRFWRQREQITRRLGAEDEAVRTDLLDLAILGAHLDVRLAPGRGEQARRDALRVLSEAEELFGPSCVLYQERRAHALALGRPAAALAPGSAWEHYALGRACWQAGEVSRALDHMERALELQPRALWPNFYKGRCAHRLGRHDDAVVAFSVCVALAPDSAWCLANRALAHAELGRPERALRDYDRALRLDPTLAGAALGRGVLHYRARRYGEALADLERARANGLDGAPLHYNLALVHLARQDRRAARRSLRQALLQDPQHAQARRLLALLVPSGKPEKSENRRPLRTRRRD